METKQKEVNALANKPKGKYRNVLYFAMLGVEIAFLWFFGSTMHSYKLAAVVPAAFSSIKAYLILLGFFLLVVDLGILVAYERKHSFASEPKNRQWIYLLIVLFLILAPIVSIFIF